MADRTGGMITFTAEQIERLVATCYQAGEYRHDLPPLVPKKWHAGRRYRIDEQEARWLVMDRQGIVWLQWRSRRLGYAMGCVKDDDMTITWDAEAMATRQFRAQDGVLLCT